MQYWDYENYRNVYNLKNETVLKQNYYVPDKNETIQDKKVMMFRRFKEAFVQYFLYHYVNPLIVPPVGVLRNHLKSPKSASPPYPIKDVRIIIP